MQGQRLPAWLLSAVDCAAISQNCINLAFISRWYWLSIPILQNPNHSVSPLFCLSWFFPSSASLHPIAPSRHHHLITGLKQIIDGETSPYMQPPEEMKKWILRWWKRTSRKCFHQRFLFEAVIFWSWVFFSKISALFSIYDSI